MKNTIWYVLDNCNANYSKYGDILIIGDHNSRTVSHFEVLEICPEIDGANCCTETENISTRVSKDSVVNQYGCKLLDLCKHDNLIIINGRTLGDLHRQYTNFTYNGSSVIDYKS